MSELQVSKWYCKVFFCSFEQFVEIWGWVKFCQKLKIFMTAVLSEISDFDHFLYIVISDLWVNCGSQNGILKSSFVELKDMWKFEFESKFCQKLKIFMPAVLSEISDFDHFLNIVIYDLWVNCRSQNGILKCSFVHLKDLYKFDFDHFLIIVISDLWVNCRSQNCILKTFYVDLKDLWKFQVE